MAFVALEVRSEETVESVIRDLMVAAQKLGSTFKVLRVLGPLELGATRFMRFETDCNRSYVRKIACDQSRGFVIPTPQGIYEVSKGAWTGTIPSATMQTPPLPAFTHMKFRGPGQPFWERQFSGVPFIGRPE